jgi:hypothetical protein
MDMSLLQYTVLHLYMSVLKQTLLPLAVSVLWHFWAVPEHVLSTAAYVSVL